MDTKVKSFKAFFMTEAADTKQIKAKRAAQIEAIKAFVGKIDKRPNGIIQKFDASDAGVSGWMRYYKDHTANGQFRINGESYTVSTEGNPLESKEMVEFLNRIHNGHIGII